MITTRIHTAEMGLPAIDALDLDALAIFVGPERPLQGLAGYADWRLCGLVSRAIRDGSYLPETGEALLLPGSGRLGVRRVFCFGLPQRAHDDATFASQARRLCQTMQKAGSTGWAGAMPDPASGVVLPDAWLFLQALLPVAPRKLVLLGDARSLQRDLGAAREALGAEQVEIVSLVSRVELPSRVAGLPHSWGVVR